MLMFIIRGPIFHVFIKWDVSKVTVTAQYTLISYSINV